MKAPSWPSAGEARLTDGGHVCVVLESVMLGGAAGAWVEIERPEDPGALLQEWCDRADPAVPIPYWGEIWPASRALARRLTGGRSLSGQSVLDFGCGLGLAGIAAALRGGSVTFLDYNPDAIAFAMRNAARAGVSGASFLAADWRDRRWARPYDLVLGADVIYDRTDHHPVAEIMSILLASGGIAWIGEPRRASTESFLADWRAAMGRNVTTWGGQGFPGEEVEVAIHELSLLGA